MSLTATQATPSSSTQKVAVLSRKLIYRAGEVVGINVPKSAVQRSYRSGGQLVRYLDFYQNVKGGAINLFVHDPNPSRFLGARIYAEVEIWEREIVGGKKNLQVNLRPTEKHPTHRMSIVQIAADIVLQNDQRLIGGSGPHLQGGILLGPTDSKIMTKQSLAAIKKTEDLKFAEGNDKATGLIERGWKISQANDKEVTFKRTLPDGQEQEKKLPRPRARR